MANKMDSEAVMEQANSVWKMLNDLADTDPQGYKKFVDKTLKEGAQEFKPPQPCFCISTVLLPEVITHKVYVNICGWDKIPGPKTDQDPVPVMAGPIERKSIDDTPHSVVDVIFNNKVLQDIEHKKDHRNLLVHLALDYLEETKKVSLSKKYKTLKTNYKGNSSNLTRYLKTPVDGKFESGNNPKVSSAQSINGHAGTKDALLEQLSSIAVGDSDEKELTQGLGLFDNDTKNVKKGLIEELSSTELNKDQVPVAKTPKYEVIVKTLEKGRSDQLVVTVELPGVSSVGECELNVSEADLLLEVDSLYRLQIDLPKKVDDSQVTASFNKTKKKLIVKLPIQE